MTDQAVPHERFVYGWDPDAGPVIIHEELLEREARKLDALAAVKTAADLLAILGWEATYVDTLKLNESPAFKQVTREDPRGLSDQAIPDLLKAVPSTGTHDPLDLRGWIIEGYVI